MKIDNLSKILAVITAAGKGEHTICAEHDAIFLLPSDEIEEDSVAGKQLIELDCFYDESSGWAVFV
jgi:hypothetical protein